MLPAPQQAYCVYKELMQWPCRARLADYLAPQCFSGWDRLVRLQDGHEVNTTAFGHQDPFNSSNGAAHDEPPPPYESVVMGEGVCPPSCPNFFDIIVSYTGLQIVVND